MRDDVRDIRVDTRSTRDRMEVQYDTLTARIDGLNESSTARTNSLNESLTARINGVNDNLTAQIVSAKSWALMLNVTMAAAILATMARSFGWL